MPDNVAARPAPWSPKGSSSEDPGALLVYGSTSPTNADGTPRGNFPDSSPFTQKLFLFLRMCGVPHTYVSQARMENLSKKAPKGKIPFVEHRGQILGDSAFIIDYLKQDAQFGERCRALDAHLTPVQHAHGHVIRVMAEEHIFWGVPYIRWLTDEGWEAGHRHAFFGPILASYQGKPERQDLWKKSFRNALRAGPGLSRHSPDETYYILNQDFAALDTLMSVHGGTGPFLFGDKPTSYDCAVFSQIACFLIEPVWGRAVPFTQQLRRNFPQLVRYCEHIVLTYYPEQAGEIL